MKKLLVIIGALMALTTMTFACEHQEETPPDDCIVCIGEKGNDGVDGKNGLSAYEIATYNGFEGTETEWLETLKGRDGESLDITKFTQEIEEYRNEVRDTQEAQADGQAGNSALAVLDFGTTCKGVTEVGVGVGYAHTPFASSTVGAVGLKHGLTDDNAVIVKVWGADSNTYGGGGAVTHRF